MTQMPSQFSKNELNNESHVWIVNLGQDAEMGVESNCSFQIILDSVGIAVFMGEMQL